MQELEEKIGYTFKTPKLLQQALTHSSFTPDIHKNTSGWNFWATGFWALRWRICCAARLPTSPRAPVAAVCLSGVQGNGGGDCARSWRGQIHHCAGYERCFQRKRVVRHRRGADCGGLSGQRRHYGSTGFRSALLDAVYRPQVAAAQGL